MNVCTRYKTGKTSGGYLPRKSILFYVVSYKIKQKDRTHSCENADMENAELLETMADPLVRG